MSAVISRPFVLAAAFPAVLMIVQILPLSFLANPVWTSVNPGFTRGVIGSISVDIGATAVALVSYLSAVGMVALAAAVAINRDRAESLLIGATAVTVFISVASLLRDLFGLNVLAMRDEARDCACLGVTLTAACAMLVFERHETRRSGTSKTRKKFPVAMAACLIAFVICAAAVWATRAGSLAFAAVSGFLTFIAIVAIRRWALGRLGAAAIGVTAAVIATALMGVRGRRSRPAIRLRQKRPSGDRTHPAHPERRAVLWRRGRHIPRIVTRVSNSECRFAGCRDRSGKAFDRDGKSHALGNCPSGVICGVYLAPRRGAARPGFVLLGGCGRLPRHTHESCFHQCRHLRPCDGFVVGCHLRAGFDPVEGPGRQLRAGLKSGASIIATDIATRPGKLAFSLQNC